MTKKPQVATKADTLPTILVIFGATGDLTKKKLIPALWHVYTQGMLPSLFTVVGFARQSLTHEEFRSHIASILPSVRGQKQKKLFNSFLRMFFYQSGVFEDVQGYKDLARVLGKQDETWNTCANKLFHLAVPPHYYKTIFQHLSDSGLTIPCGGDEGWTRVIVEKPFGKDLQTAQELDEMLGTLFKEEQIYRIDHYLGKDTVQNILAFRFSNTFLQPAWDARSISSIHIRMTEKQGVDGRATFYDGVGALRDVGQNHLLQLLALFTMDNPSSFEAEAIRRERAKALQSLEIMDEEDVVRNTVRGQYKGYTSLKGVVKKSQTETYFKVQAHMNSSRWRGVPMYLESGKSLSSSSVEVLLTFRHHTPCLCPPGKHYTNVLRYHIQPQEGIFTSFWVKKPGQEVVIEQKDFSFDYRKAFKNKEFVDAYAKLLLDAIAGDQTQFVSTEEIMASWKFIDPIIRVWTENKTKLHPYAARSTGPASPAGRPLWPPKVSGDYIPNKQIGYIGLGKMGANMVARLKEYGWDIVAFDPDEKTRTSVARMGVRVTDSEEALIKKLRGPKLIWLMTPHQVVDDVLAKILPHLSPGDTVIDAGNSMYKHSIRRFQQCAKQGIHFLDIGVSGGPSGALKGACLMIGGEKQVYKKYSGLFSDIATAGGYDYVGGPGAGHFVKMVHNGIEYGMMQAIAEGFAVMKTWPNNLNLEQIANLYNHDSVIESRLVGWLKDAYATYGEELQDISGTVAHSGEGQWTVEAAKELGIPVPIIEQALQFRVESSKRPSYTGQIVSALRNQFGGHSVAKK